MSTCPENELYSAYIDNEVPSPWKEKLERHLASCPDCKKKTDRFRTIQTMLGAGAKELSERDLEASFSRLASRRIPSVHTRRPRWTGASVMVPIPALAALFMAVFFVPAYLAIRSNGASSNLPQTALLPGVTGQGANVTNTVRSLSASTPVYSPDLVSYATTESMLDTNANRLFTMVNFASQFATDKDLFKDAEIIIIKLPNLSRFSNTGEQVFGTDEPLQKAAGFYK